jgi:hypothetical protein
MGHGWQGRRRSPRAPAGAVLRALHVRIPSHPPCLLAADARGAACPSCMLFSSNLQTSNFCMLLKFTNSKVWKFITEII